jgi:16S rRNA (adenine1518-N6/adenine1519-N6)-dimethyltransferase
LQTKRQIQQLLASAGITAKKHLGQHFLIDLNLMRLLVDSANINSSDIVLEVGCGTGSLTEAIVPLAGKIIAVEIDSNLAEIAKKQLAGANNVTILNTDILKNKNTISQTVLKLILNYKLIIKNSKLKIISNLPYNVASAVMINLVTGPIAADAMYVTVQKEVAKRMTAAPGSSDYGTLSVFLNATGEVKTIRILKPTVFWPQPQVDSAMVSFVRKEEKASRIKSIKLFTEGVNLFMQHRRKMLKACIKFIRRGGFAIGPLGQISNLSAADLAKADWPQIFEQCSIDPCQRGEQLSPENYITFANICCKYITSNIR